MFWRGEVGSAELPLSPFRRPLLDVFVVDVEDCFIKSVWSGIRVLDGPMDPSDVHGDSRIQPTSIQWPKVIHSVFSCTCQRMN